MFRVLDLGAHDGFVSTWLARQFPTGHLHVDGVEANVHGCEVMNRRLKELGIDGECKVGLAEDAPRLFDTESYDAVIAFEIIEHVPDVPRFLSVCEAMCNETGRIYLSTPDGTFGLGQNPHHLRAYRATDLFDILRRRGFVEDMTVGIDTVTVASYTPHDDQYPRPECAIFTGPSWQKWSPLDIESKGLGGSETAAARLAEALTGEGYVVTVYGEVEPMAWKQVSFRDWRAFDPTERRDLVISSRTPGLGDRYVNARKKVLWMHDTDYGPGMTPERVEKFDKIAVLSMWHRDHVLDMYPFIDPDKILVTRNGIEPGYFTVDPDDAEDQIVRNPHRAIYSSSPDRGLDIILEAWPKVRKLVPDAELYYCYSDVYDAVAKGNPTLAAYRERINYLTETDGVFNLGSLPQQGLACAMRECGVWLAPGWCTPAGQRFHETYCIGAVEAAAAGCHLVMSNWGALRERADNAVSFTLLPGDGDGRPDPDVWAEEIAQAMKSPAPGPSEVALASTWREVALDIIEAL